jgi:hypothetical protein
MIESRLPLVNWNELVYTLRDTCRRTDLALLLTACLTRVPIDILGRNLEILKPEHCNILC